MARTINLLKQFSLSELGDDWKDCYIKYTPMTIGDVTEVSQLNADGMSEVDSVNFMVQHIKKHFAGGRISVIEDGKPVTVDMTVDDVDVLPIEVIGDLFAEMSGGSLDPKDSETAQKPKSEPTSSESTTETPSSES